MESAFLGGPGRSCQPLSGPSAAPGSPWPRGWAVAPKLHGCHRPRPVLALTSSRALQTRGPSLGRDRMSQALDALRIGGRQSGSDGVGEGSDGEGKRSGTRQAPLAGSLLLATADPSNPHSPRPPPPPPPPQSVDSLGERTPPSDKLVERRAAGERHLTVPERCLGSPGGARLAFYRSLRSRQPPGAPPRRAQRARWSSREPRASISEQPQSGREHCAWRELPTRAAEAARLRGSPSLPPAPRGLPAKPGEAECALAALGGSCAVTGHAPALREARAEGYCRSRAPSRALTPIGTQEVVVDRLRPVF